MAEFLNNNIKFLRSEKNISQQKLADEIGVDRSTISRIENGEIETTIDNAIKISNALNVSINDLISKNLQFDNAEHVDMPNLIKIPVFGYIKAGIPIENQNDIIEYVEIPGSWTRGGKQFFGLKVSGDSMSPKYNENDIVIFEQNDDLESYNGKDAAIMINHTESTFKKIHINEQGIVLQPYNNSYNFMIYTKEQIEQLPVKVVGIAVEKRTKV